MNAPLVDGGRPYLQAPWRLPYIGGGAQIVVADPPWRFASNSAAKPGRNVRRHYQTMSSADIAKMPVRDIVARKALLLMWTTSPMLALSMPVLEAWGFRYVSQLVWIKDSIGTGYWSRNRHELVLLATRGGFPCPKPAPWPDSVIEAPKREHSRKPDELQDRIDAVWPGARKVELFARRKRPGWICWGSEVERFA